MVYKKYIKRGDKIYGPYSYKSIKKNGKVITEYIGKPLEKKSLRKNVLLGTLGLVVFLSLVFMMTSEFSLVGNVILDVGSDYEQGQFVVLLVLLCFCRRCRFCYGFCRRLCYWLYHRLFWSGFGFGCLFSGNFGFRLTFISSGQGLSP